MITPEQHAEIRRLYFGEHWKVGTIAAALGVHHDTVRAAIAHDTHAVRRGTCRATQLDPYLPFIRDTLAQYPRLRATRLFEMVRAPRLHRLGRATAAHRADDSPGGAADGLSALDDADGRRGAGRLGRLRVHPDRPRRPAALRLCDGALVLARPLCALHARPNAREFSARPRRGLCRRFRASRAPWSTTTFAVPSSNARAPRFGFIRACSSSPATITSPRGPVHPGRANEKGKIERQIHYLRQAFFAARTFADVDDLNAQFRRWRDEIAHQRPHPEQRDRTVAEVFAEEQPRLLPLPAHPFETDVMRTVTSGKTPYVRFDRNHYSIPHTHVRRPLTLLASADHGPPDRRHARRSRGTPAATTPGRRSSRRRTSPASSPRRGRPIRRVRATASASPSPRSPRSSSAWRRAANRCGPTPRACSALLDDYGPQELAAAVTQALETDALGAGAIAHLLEHTAPAAADRSRRSRSCCPIIPASAPRRHAPSLGDLRCPHSTRSRRR